MAERMNNLTGKEWLQNSFSIWRDVTKTSEERATKHPALFPQLLAEKLIQIYTKNPGEVILDPFLGIGSTLKAAYSLGKQGVGIDLNKEFVKIAKKRVKDIQADLLDIAPEIERFEPKIYTGDSRKLLKHVDEESVDLVVTSPPYWDILNQKRTADSKEIRNYSDSDEDLGNIHNYEEFLENLKQVMTQVYKALKPNKRCCSVVMDLRKKDKFFPLHEDQTRIMREIGFELEEYVIWDRQKEYNNMKTLGYPWVFRFNKVHEFICVYWKR
ncbi:site-specific DNA-methyltransferase [Polynucleobacter sp. IMCC30063]|uniref:DNA methyltransferase n=1 Tax=Polynucleobacter sp. IMCC30063 TaxID=2907298 RepID=UPI001F2A78E3|nr:DNA methyltransferase [Polynucleobacter sp. IMCC30063]MCE7506966.1 site-specific DNA-methyltransferase [Polynucleobacter sp. IMCC30063]